MAEAPSTSVPAGEGEEQVDLAVHPSGIVPQLQVGPGARAGPLPWSHLSIASLQGWGRNPARDWSCRRTVGTERLGPAPA